jgi:microcystin-dependent protein
MADAYTGEIRIFCGNYAPENWLLCKGTLLSINQYQALYSLIGITYGGDGITNFALPNLQGRLPVGDGTPTSGINYPAGSFGGTDTETLTVNTIPAHTHYFSASSAAGNTTKAGNTAYLATVDSSIHMYLDTTKGTCTSASLNTLSVSTTGSSYPHDNNMPSITLNYMICVNGYYPQLDT